LERLARRVERQRDQAPDHRQRGQPDRNAHGVSEVMLGTSSTRTVRAARGTVRGTVGGSCGRRRCSADSIFAWTRWAAQPGTPAASARSSTYRTPISILLSGPGFADPAFARL